MSWRICVACQPVRPGNRGYNRGLRRTSIDHDPAWPGADDLAIDQVFK